MVCTLVTGMGWTLDSGTGLTHRNSGSDHLQQAAAAAQMLFSLFVNFS